MSALTEPLSWLRHPKPGGYPWMSIEVSWFLGTDMSYRPIPEDEIRIQAPDNATLSRVPVAQRLTLTLKEGDEDYDHQFSSKRDRLRQGTVSIQCPGVVGTVILSLFDVRQARRVIAVPLTLFPLSSAQEKDGFESATALTRTVFPNVSESAPLCIAVSSGEPLVGGKRGVIDDQPGKASLVVDSGTRLNISYNPMEDNLLYGNLIICRAGAGDNDSRLDNGPFGTNSSLVLDTIPLKALDDVSCHSLSVLAPAVPAGEREMYQVRFLRADVCSFPRSVAVSRPFTVVGPKCENPWSAERRRPSFNINDYDLHAAIEGSVEVFPSVCYPKEKIRVSWNFLTTAGSMTCVPGSKTREGKEEKMDVEPISAEERLSILQQLLTPVDTIDCYPCARKELTDVKGIDGGLKVGAPLLKGSVVMEAPSFVGGYDVAYHSFLSGISLLRTAAPLKVVLPQVTLELEARHESTPSDVLLGVRYSVPQRVFDLEGDRLWLLAPEGSTDEALELIPFATADTVVFQEVFVSSSVELEEGVPVEKHPESCSLAEQMTSYQGETVCGLCAFKAQAGLLPRALLPGCRVQYYSAKLGTVLETATVPVSEKTTDNGKEPSASRLDDVHHEQELSSASSPSLTLLTKAVINLSVDSLIEVDTPIEVQLSWSCAEEDEEGGGGSRKKEQMMELALRGCMVNIRPMSGIILHQHNGEPPEGFPVGPNGRGLEDTTAGTQRAHVESVSWDHRKHLFYFRPHSTPMVFPPLTVCGKYIVEVLEPIPSINRSRLALCDAVISVGHGYATNTPLLLKRRTKATVHRRWLFSGRHLPAAKNKRASSPLCSESGAPSSPLRLSSSLADEREAGELVATAGEGNAVVSAKYQEGFGETYHGIIVCQGEAYVGSELTVSIHLLSGVLRMDDCLELWEHEHFIESIPFETLLKWLPASHIHSSRLHTVTFSAFETPGIYHVVFRSAVKRATALRSADITVKPQLPPLHQAVVSTFTKGPRPPAGRTPSLLPSRPANARAAIQQSPRSTGATPTKKLSPVVPACSLRALLVGCCYLQKPYELVGPVNDVEALRDVLRAQYGLSQSSDGSSSTAPVTLLTELSGDSSALVPTARNIRRQLALTLELYRTLQEEEEEEEEEKKEPRHFLFYFSGHGSVCGTGLNPKAAREEYQLHGDGTGLDYVLHPVDSDWGPRTITVKEISDFAQELGLLGVKTTVVIDAGFSVGLLEAAKQKDIRPVLDSFVISPPRSSNTRDPPYSRRQRITDEESATARQKLWPLRVHQLKKNSTPTHRNEKSLVPPDGMPRPLLFSSSGDEKNTNSSSSSHGYLLAKAQQNFHALYMVPHGPVFETSGMGGGGRSFGALTVSFLKALQEYAAEVQDPRGEGNYFGNKTFRDLVQENLHTTAPQHGEMV